MTPVMLPKHDRSHFFVGNEFSKVYIARAPKSAVSKKEKMDSNEQDKIETFPMAVSEE